MQRFTRWPTREWYVEECGHWRHCDCQRPSERQKVQVVFALVAAMYVSASWGRDDRHSQIDPVCSMDVRQYLSVRVIAGETYGSWASVWLWNSEIVGERESMTFPPYQHHHAPIYKPIYRNWKLALTRTPDLNRYQICTR